VNCGLGRLTLGIDPEGNVYPCLQWRHESLGNVRRTPLRDLWRGSDVRQRAADVATEANARLGARGDAASRFPFCPALAWQKTGDALTPDAPFLAAAEAAEAVRQATA
jgi:MoaA/NifB/PqqE/SkfB family radical SAM enzyme